MLATRKFQLTQLLTITMRLSWIAQISPTKSTEDSSPDNKVNWNFQFKNSNCLNRQVQLLPVATKSKYCLQDQVHQIEKKKGKKKLSNPSKFVLNNRQVQSLATATKSNQSSSQTDHRTNKYSSPSCYNSYWSKPQLSKIWQKPQSGTKFSWLTESNPDVKTAKLHNPTLKTQHAKVV